ncbi:bifunctional 3-(3-hydroxy-phenyl)propionate/3-hydroxycinnamic acid hydroxylase [Mesorhizobium sp. L-8-3]|uniref:bifunctional 3-(3-hydroxy-phenyl)propionate/3-hydroxycinnamic acid hydroxylase n=1 Tax=Mesorhizobium sp. L-8-3 TaxID=2744522 RepID=UPI0019264AF5|nr:bifunctional 3-(3-hydroxy-phenyl)propionate/3-hydroxycinnamic acid hydroxylase [Mesorhizobium sp. L-8-3]BCH27766.1 FAD-binding monooxygenase [Mesorhizobium sp. L-8-3]
MANPQDQFGNSLIPDGKCDVVVVGLGPVGITLCNLLASQGVVVEGFDAADEVHALPRAIGFDHEVMRVFQQIGASTAVSPALGEYRPSEYRSADGVLLRRLESPPEPHPLAWPPYQTFLQPRLEEALRVNARRFSNLRTHTGVEIVKLEHPAEPRVTLRNRATGALIERRPRFVVGCDGANSFIRRGLGVELEDLDFDEPWLVVDLILEDENARLPETNIQFCDPARPRTYVRGPGRLRRWEFMVMPGESPAEINRPERIQELLSPWLRPGQGRVWRSATYNFHALVARQWRLGRVFLAGDACHMTPPFLAQGMTQGIKDAANLAWKLAHVIDGGAEHVLDTYEAERKPFVRDVIEVTKRLGQIICELEPEKARARDAEMIATMAAGKGIQIRQNLFPPIRHGLVDATDGSVNPGTGEPCPQPWVEGPAGRLRLDDAIPGGFRLLIAQAADASPDLLRLARKTGVAVHQIAQDHCHPSQLVEQHGVFAAWLAEKGAVAALVRPDHLVFGTAATIDDAKRLLEKLDARLCGTCH